MPIVWGDITDKEGPMPPPFPELPGQLGLATTAQLFAAGWSEAQIDHWSKRVGRRVMPTVFAQHRGELHGDHLVTAALLWAGEGAMLTGAHAVARHGLPLPGLPTRYRFVVPERRRAREHPLAVTVRSARPCTFRILGGIPTVGLERALDDVGRYRELSPVDVRAATIAALQQRRTTPARLRAEFEGGRRNGMRFVRLGLLDFEGGAWSMAEVTLGRILRTRRRRLRFEPNPRVETPDGGLIGYPDAYLLDHGVAIMVHSREHHDGFGQDARSAWEATVGADSIYAAHGIASIGVAPTALRDRPEWFLSRLDAVVLAQRDRPRPSVVIKPTVGRTQREAS